ncbi:MAG: Gfo/Idh/MocA family oxidoreductase, partial [Spirochaetaceae bacterium]|nr:Gfo/Idh/MocA family oxidoreductase [Spirochaetaceae bacterium]
AIQRAEDSHLVAVYSRDQSRAQAFAEKQGASAAYSDLSDLLSDSRVEAVFVASPTHLHAPQVIRAAAAGKHVLCEKPMATTVPDACAMVDACRDHGVTLGLGFELRFHPAHLWARKLLDDGSIGRIRLAHGQWGRGNRGEPEHLPRSGLREWWETPELIGDASVLVGLGVHVFDLTRFLLRDEVVEVVAMTDGQTDRQPLEHIATISLRMSSGTIMQVMCGRMLPDTQNDLAIYGSDGRFATRETIWEARLGQAEVVSDALNKAESYEYDYLANFVDELEDFRDALESGRAPRATGEDGVAAARIPAAAIESAKTGRAVRISTPHCH